MDNQLFFQQFSQLPDKAQEEAMLFLEFLMSKYQVATSPQNPKKSAKRVFGISKGDYQMQSDFDAELADFKD
ncbi:MAG: DUF2281 domain-containing protein [Microscillaceae bacterium]|nr:DUF2281 domain-containing protein [Microscillaceae bacterium]